MEVYVARQPIFNKKRKVYGYELLFRDGMSNVFPEIDGETATSELLSNSFFSIGLNNLVGRKKAFINFTQQLLLQRVPMMFPPEMIMVEVLEDVEPREDVISACEDIARNGYGIALDDFFYRADLVRFVELAKIIKIDFKLTPIEEIKELVKKLTPYRVKLLAEKVETREEFQQASEMGFQYFQGYFFRKPEVLKGKDINPSRISVLQILAEINKQDFTFGKVEELIFRDLSLSYKLMRYINSSYFRRIKEVSSIKYALVLLGEKEVRRFISLMALAKLAPDKPNELIRASIIRARLLELLGKNESLQIDASELFTLGLFSLIDAIMDSDMEDLMEKLALSQRIKSALVKREGELADFLNLAACYERGDWHSVSEIVPKIKLSGKKIPQYYVDAVSWADSLLAI